MVTTEVLLNSYSELDGVQFTVTSDRLDGLSLAVNATDEGLILDLYDKDGEVVGTQAMMYDEWADWILDDEGAT